MGTIDTMRFQDQSVRIGTQNFDAMDMVPFRTWGKVAVAMSVAKLQKRRTRYNLMKLDHHSLHDIGISVEDADIEIRKSFPMYVRSDS
ncbi:MULTISPECIES: DUF1127 domain-containing protein [Ahrensia]|uniref:DUF1127 domain-containing protein n=1 Tax=Ahrensia TaxID=152180 RepID=UPI00035EEBDA|nr:MULTISPECIES: DUF1127 domain-containing protein [Ahrensia]